MSLVFLVVLPTTFVFPKKICAKKKAPRYLMIHKIHV